MRHIFAAMREIKLEKQDWFSKTTLKRAENSDESNSG